ncbi:MAG: Vitamin B12 import ATP-binding protein BtuD [Desulfovibrio sp.]
MSLLDVHGLSVAFAGAGMRQHGASRDRRVVHDVSFMVERGQCVALVGESGAGKTLTSRSIVRLLPRGAFIQSGKILYEGVDIAALPEKDVAALRGKKIGMVFQDPLAALNPLHRVGDQVAECLRVHKGLTDRQLRARVMDLFDLVRLDRPEERYRAYPHELSGGQRQRIMLALAAANDPDLLIADEPTTALDATVQQAILRLLGDLRRELGMSLLLISHDLGMVRRFADTVHVMRHGRILESSSTLFANPEHEYTRTLLRAGGNDWAQPVLSEEAGPVLTVKDLCVRFPRHKTRLFQRKPSPFTALEGVDLVLRPGECLGIVGESGSGKSTLAMAVLRLIASSGSISFMGQDIQRLNHAEMAPLRSRIQVVFQNPFLSLNPRMCVRDLVEEGLRVHGFQADQCAARVNEVLVDVGLTPAYAERFPHELSGGERQRVAIARSLALRPEVLLLDEPTSSLDRALQFQIIDLLRGLQARYGMAFIYISHDLALVKGFCQRVLVLHKGQCVEQGNVREVFAAPQSAHLQALLEAALPGDAAGCSGERPARDNAPARQVVARRRRQVGRAVRLQQERRKRQKKSLIYSVLMHVCLLGALWGIPLQASGGGESSMQVSLVGMGMGTAVSGTSRASNTDGTDPEAPVTEAQETPPQDQKHVCKKKQAQVEEKPDLILKEKRKPRQQVAEQEETDKTRREETKKKPSRQTPPRSLGSQSAQGTDAESAGSAADSQGSGRNDGGQGGGSGGGLGLHRGKSQGAGSVYGVNQWDKPPVVIQRVKPNYPEEAKRARKEGIVTVRAVIDAEGRVLRAVALPGNDVHLFAQETLTAVKRWRFAPGKVGGNPVMCVVEIPVIFRLDR